MPYQSGQSVSVNYAKQSAFGTRASASASREFPLNPGNGMKESRSIIQSNRIRSDGLASPFRHGFRESVGAYTADLLIGGHDDILAGAHRGVWSAVPAVNSLTLTIAGSAGTITRSAGSWITDNISVGMVGRLAGFTAGAAANNGRNLVVVNVTATVLTVVPISGGNLVDASAVASTSFTVPGRFVRTAKTNSFFTVEERVLDISGGLIFDDVAVRSMQVTWPAEGNITTQFATIGRQMEVLTGGSYPYFTTGNIVVPTGEQMVAADAALFMVAAEGKVVLSAFNFTYDVAASSEKTVGSLVTPDLFFGNGKLTGSLTALTQDMTMIQKYAAETEFPIFAAVELPTQSPRPFVIHHLTSIKFTDFDKNMGNAGALTVTLPFQGMTKELSTGNAKSMLNTQISNAS